MTFRTLMIAAAALAAPIAVIAPAHADGGVFVGVEGSNIAVSGYDTVSYFQGDGVPVKGSADYKVNHNGAVWYFANQANADAFKANPAAYAPKYGGHCAWAMSRGALAPGDPTLYKIVDGDLYLNFNPNVQKTWLADIDGFIAKSDPAWTKIPDGKKFGD
ncbi:YHS domain-containing (seleno)protein [Erythrobacter rubeus]|uniref:YHS domain-containing protein n=1 Tax=Erythrobacter rubeus TaxID=2760803 RepID=A0ABR8KUP5_9SPHN|nr:YHS domain-containing (seleno)protein [Erythrobacter rubeus]MBD2841961.1 YHS domain-containing protein [Erythrobacter rubeus]